jgi:positive regulator of sigma E activity
MNMDEIARVLKIEGTTITVKGGELDGCVGCMNDACRTNGSSFTAENRSGLALGVGQLVQITSSTAATAGQAAFVFLPPFIAFAAAYAGVGFFFPGSSEALRAAAGVAGLALGFLAIYWFRKVSPSKASPSVVRVVPEEEFEATSTLGGAAEAENVMT